MASLTPSNTNTITTPDNVTAAESGGQEKRDASEKEMLLMKKLAAFTTSIVHLNVGGKKMSTSRATLTLIEGTLLATMFSGQLDDKLVKDVDGAYFFDYDPILFKHLINELRYWSLNPTATRVFRQPSRCEEEFIGLVRSLKFEERFISETFAYTGGSGIQIFDSRRLCVKTADDRNYGYVVGNLLYSSGLHRQRLRIDYEPGQPIFIGIRSHGIPLQINSTKKVYQTQSSYGWSLGNYLVFNGEIIKLNWISVSLEYVFQLTLDCDGRTLAIREDRCLLCPSMRNMSVDLSQAPFPWQLFIVLPNKNNFVRLLW